MKDDLDRMKQKLAALRLRKGTILARAAQVRGGSGAEQLGAKGKSSAFENFRRMEEKIEGREAESAALAEVEESLSQGRKSDADVEAKFRELERQTGGGEPGKPGAAGPTEIDDDLAALKKRIRV
jgi:phage shock protein A